MPRRDHSVRFVESKILFRKQRLYVSVCSGSSLRRLTKLRRSKQTAKILAPKYGPVASSPNAPPQQKSMRQEHPEDSPPEILSRCDAGVGGARLAIMLSREPMKLGRARIAIYLLQTNPRKFAIVFPGPLG
jgi:hypothetical protein